MYVFNVADQVKVKQTVKSDDCRGHGCLCNIRFNVDNKWDTDLWTVEIFAG